MHLESLLSHVPLDGQIFSYLADNDMFCNIRVQNKNLRDRVDSCIREKVFQRIKNIHPTIARGVLDGSCSLEKVVNLSQSRLFYKQIIALNGVDIAIDFSKRLVGLNIGSKLGDEMIVDIISYLKCIYLLTSIGKVFCVVHRLDQHQDYEYDVEEYNHKLQNLQIKEIINSNQGGLFFLTRGGQVLAKGRNNNGHLGLGNYKLFFEPRLVKAALEEAKVKYLRSSYGFSIAVSRSGLIYGWGKNECTRLLLTADEVNVFEPRLILNGFFGFRIKDVILSYHGFFILTQDGKLYSFMNVNSDRLGIVDLDIQQYRVLEKKNVVKVVSDGNCAFALTDENRVYVMGGYKLETGYQYIVDRLVFFGPTPLKGVFTAKDVKQMLCSIDGRVVLYLSDGSIYSHSNRNIGVNKIDLSVVLFRMCTCFNMLLYLIALQRSRSSLIEYCLFILNMPAVFYLYVNSFDEEYEGIDVYKFNRVFDPYELKDVTFYSSQNEFYLKTEKGQTFRLKKSCVVQKIHKNIRDFSLQRMGWLKTISHLAFSWGYRSLRYAMQRYLDELRATCNY